MVLPVVSKSPHLLPAPSPFPSPPRTCARRTGALPVVSMSPWPRPLPYAAPGPPTGRPSMQSIWKSPAPGTWMSWLAERPA